MSSERMQVHIRRTATSDTSAKNTFVNSYATGLQRFLISLDGWDVPAVVSRETYAKWDGSGHYVSRRARVQPKTVTLSVFIKDIGTNIRDYDEYVSSLGASRGIRLEVTRIKSDGSTHYEYMQSGMLVSEAVTWDRLNEGVKISIPITFAIDPYRYNQTGEEKRL